MHLFGYVDDNNPDNNTPYFDYKGKANPENVKKTNGYKKLNEKAFEKRRQQLKKHGKTPPKEIVSAMPTIKPEEIRMIQYFGVLECREVYNKISFD